MTNLIYSIPTWVVGTLIVAMAAAVSALGLLVVHRCVPTETRRPHNDIAGYISNIAAFVYAVLLAFIAVAVWQQYEQAQTTALREANAASDIFRQAEGYPEPLRRRVRDDIQAYVNIVIADEWPRQANGGISSTAWDTIEALHRAMLDFEPRAGREHVVHTAQLNVMTNLLDYRRSRIDAGGSGLHPVIWTVILVGSMVIVAFAYFMGTGNFRAHLAMTALLGASIGLVIFLIVAMDYPFRGDVGIQPTAFMQIRENIRRVAGE